MYSSGSEILVLSQSEVASLFDLDAAYESQRNAFTAIGEGAPLPAEKVMLNYADTATVTFAYAARLAPFGPICKFGSVNPSNVDLGLPTVSSTILALDPHTGELAAVMDGTTITNRRTAAASVLVMNELAQPGELRATIIGYGVQAREHVRMIAARARPARLRVYGRSFEKCQSFVREMSAETGIDMQAMPDIQSSVGDANVVVLCTTSTTPLIASDWIAEGTLVLSLGSISATRCEVGQDFVRRVGRVIVDDKHSAHRQAGPVIAAIQSGLLHDKDLVEFGHVLVGQASGRANLKDVIYYNSTGIGLQDAAAVAAILTKAKARVIGQRISL